MEESQKKEKMKNIFIVVLLFLVIGLGGYLVYDKILSSDDNKTIAENKKQENKQEKKEEEVVTTLDVSDPMVTELYQTLKNGWGQYCGIWDYFTKTKVKSSDITNKVATVIAVDQLYKKDVIGNRDPGENQFTKNQLDAEVDRIFGKDYVFQPSNIFHYEYDASTGIYHEEKTVGLGGACGVPNLDKIVKAEKQGNQLRIYTRVIFHIEGTDATNFFKDYDKTQVITLDRDENGYVINSDSNYEKGSLYKMNFVLEDGNYIFVSSEPVQN